MHAEAVLLVDDGQCEIVENNVLLEKRMGTEQKIDVAKRETIEDLLSRRPTFTASEYRDANAGGFGQRRDSSEMLTGKNFRRRHECSLSARFDDGRCSSKSNYGFAGPDIALQQPQHSLRTGKNRD